jgi:hypothetical protein
MPFGVPTSVGVPSIDVSRRSEPDVSRVLVVY